jgi:hypothetical protein
MQQNIDSSRQTAEARYWRQTHGVPCVVHCGACKPSATLPVAFPWLIITVCSVPDADDPTTTAANTPSPLLCLAAKGNAVGMLPDEQHASTDLIDIHLFRPF